MQARLTTAMLLVGLVLASVQLKVGLSTQHPRFDAADETGYYRAESALQYHYASLVASGRDIPEIDRAAQYPEGIRTRRELTTWMERLVGLSYKLMGGQTPFRWFCVLWVALVSSLSIVAFYFCALRLSKQPGLSLAAAAAYGLSWAAQANVIASFRLETLGLPLIFSSLACSAAVLDPKEKKPHAWGAAAAGFLFLAFGSWHFSRFYAIAYLAAVAAAWARDRRNQRLILAAVYPAIAALAALLLIASARESLFIASPGAYGHVYGLLFEKLRHGFRHPIDPAALSPVMRLEWTGPSNSPDAGFMVFALLPLLFALLPRFLGKPERGAFGDVVDALLAVFTIGFLLSSRLLPWLAFFVVLAAARRKQRWSTALFLTIAGVEAFKTYAPASPLNPFMRFSAPLASKTLRPSFSFNSERELLAWLRQNGGEEKPVLASMGLSPAILAYAGTPVLLQPKFEAPGIRAKTAEFAATLFDSEQAFAAYCRRYGARFFVYGADAILDETPEGLRYASGRMSLRPDSAAFLFHFNPGGLKHFRFLFQNDAYRVYELASATPVANDRPALIYDLSQYAPRPMPDGTVVLDVDSVLRRMERARLQAILRYLIR